MIPGVTQETLDAELDVIATITEADPDVELDELIGEFEYHQQALQIREQIWGCKACKLVKTCLKPVAMLGEAVRPTLVALGEAPGRYEDEEGLGFTGRSGQLLRASAKKVGVEVREFLNVCACRPPKNRTPEPDEIEACRGNLEAQIEHTKPWMILTFGNTPLHALTGNTGLKVTQSHGVFYTTIYPGIWGYSFFHPSYVLRNAEVARMIPQNDEDARKMKQAELVVRKWAEDWERLGHMMVFRRELGADIVESYRDDFINQKTTAIMKEVAKGDPVGWGTVHNPWGEHEGLDVDEIPF